MDQTALDAFNLFPKERSVSEHPFSSVASQG